MREFKAVFILFCLCAGLMIIFCQGCGEDTLKETSTARGAHVVPRQDAPQLVLPTGHADEVNSIAFSTYGKYALSGSLDNTLKLWEVATGREMRTFTGHNNSVTSVAFSPDSKYALSGSLDNTLKLWKVATGRELRTFTGHTDYVTSVAISPDGKYALSGSWDSTLKLWELATGREVRTFAGHTSWVTSVAISPDGKYALSGLADKTLKLWELATGKEVRTFTGHYAGVRSVAFSPDGKYAISGSGEYMAVDNTLRLWEVKTGRTVRTFAGYTSDVNSVTFSPDGKYALSGSKDRTLKLWEVATGKEVRTFTGHALSVESVAFSGDGEYALSGSADNTLKLWKIETGKEIRSFAGHANYVESIVISPDGKYALYGNMTLKLWNMATGREVRTFAGFPPAVFSPDGKYILSGSKYDLKLWKVDTGKEVRSLRTFGVNPVAFTPDSKYALFGRGKDVILWDIATENEVRAFAGHTNRINSVAISPDGKYALSGSKDRTLKLWEVATGKLVRTLDGHTSDVNSVAFSPDGKYILSGSDKILDDNALKLWEVKTGRTVRTLDGHTDDINSVAFSPDGKYALSGSADRTLKLWEIVTGKEVRTLDGHTGDVISVTISPDGKYAISGSDDKTIKLWEIDTGRLLYTRLYISKSDWVVATPDGRFDGSPDGTKYLHYKKDNKSIPLDALFDKFYTPNLVAKVLSGEELPPDAPDIRKGIEMPPVVRIVSPKTGETFRERSVDVVVEAVDQGGGVEDIRLYHNGKRLEGEGRGMKKVEGVRRNFTVSLVSGMNTLRATAYSRDRTEAHPFEISIEVKIAEATADLYIVAVGINSYKNNSYNLNYGVPDAEAVVDCISGRGKGIFREINVQKVLDEEATRSGIEAALTQVERKSRPEDVFVFYYAGHGVMSEGSKETPADFYLIPTDVTQMYGNDALLAEKAISAMQMREICRRIEARKQLLILDACQSGKAVDTFAMRGAAEEKAIAQLARSAGLVVLASTESEQFATEFAELGHGLFTYALLKAMEGDADGSPKDGRVTISELSGYIQAKIPELSERYRGEPQYPNVYVRGQDFPVTVP